ncbi:MAG TPA: bifunctional diguanylate cyclase/phosphodiesterase [Candidatus Limnocylindrales bacterium]
MIHAPSRESVIPANQQTPALARGGSTNLRLVRLRLFLALFTMFVIPVAISTPVVYGLARGSGTSLIVPTVAIIALAGVLGLLTVWLAHRVLEPAEELEAALRTLEGAYDQARSEALLDALTGLGNHRAFQEEIERQWAIAGRYNRALALVLLDLDEFKQINDSSGHAAGDLLLRRMGSHITGHLRRSDRAFRIGGDEFAILLPETDGDGAYVVSRRLLATSLEGEARRAGASAMSFSAGIAAVPGSARDRETLYSQADAALYWGKRHGRTVVTVYDRERHEGATTEHKPAELSALVARVAASGAVRAVFQPIYDLATGAPRGFEGLVRPLPNTGFNDSATMFAAAEATGRTAELDIACLEAVMGAASRLRLPGSLALNVSPRTFETDEFSIQGLLRIMVRHGLDPRRIVLELTEREAVEDIDRLRRAAEDCRVAGIRLAADDVGSGNAGLRLLSQLRFDIVKIDLSLVQGGTRHEQSLEVVRTLRDLADRWGALVVAEGIETPAQLEVVRSLGIGAGQGYLLGSPAEQPPIGSIDLDGLLRGSDWLIDALRAVPA